MGTMLDLTISSDVNHATIQDCRSAVQVVKEPVSTDRVDLIGDTW